MTVLPDLITALVFASVLVALLVFVVGHREHLRRPVLWLLVERFRSG